MKPVPAFIVRAPTSQKESLSDQPCLPYNIPNFHSLNSRVLGAVIEINQNGVTVIEFPGGVSNKRKALSMLGGIHAVSSAVLNGRQLELKFQLDNLYFSALIAERQNKAELSSDQLNLMMRVRRKRGSKCHMHGGMLGDALARLQLFFSFFKSLVGKEVMMELKNDLSIVGTLHSVDQYFNMKLQDIRVVNVEKYPHMLSVRSCFIRGSVVRYVQLPADGSVDVELLQDATRKEILQLRQQQAQQAAGQHGKGKDGQVAGK